MASTSSSEAKRPAKPAGKIATASPTAAQTANAIPPPTQAVRRASGQSPCPTARPTSAVSAEPTPKASGIMVNSSRAATP